jgi:hypothetical protein
MARLAERGVRMVFGEVLVTREALRARHGGGCVRIVTGLALGVFLGVMLALATDVAVA